MSGITCTSGFKPSESICLVENSIQHQMLGVPSVTQGCFVLDLCRVPTLGCFDVDKVLDIWKWNFTEKVMGTSSIQNFQEDLIWLSRCVCFTVSIPTKARWSFVRVQEPCFGCWRWALIRLVLRKLRIGVAFWNQKLNFSNFNITQRSQKHYFWFPS